MKETLEEAAHEYFKRGQFGLEKASDTEEAFLRGAKWQQERSYSEDEVIDLLQWLTDDKSIYSIIYGNKKYRFATNDKDFTSKELLEQFKKK